MTDIHSHILPEMDDGSRNVAESIEMLNMLSRQGIDRVAATPHYSANNESVAEFLARRQKSHEKLRAVLADGMPQILLGAEVSYYEGISRLEGLRSLCIRGTDLLLIEMPECKWSEYAVRELTDISSDGKIIPVIAHIERCIFYQSKGVFYRLIENGILMQMNAGFINGFPSRLKALKLFKKSHVHFIGSDCHNTGSRSPDIGRAYSVLLSKLGENYMSGFTDYIENYFENKNEILKG